MRNATMILAGAIALLAMPAAAFTGEPDYGAGAAVAALADGRDLSLADMLLWAAQDEYLARAEYRTIIGAFGSQRPYTNIMATEDQHLAWIKAVYRDRGFSFPADGSTGRTIAPTDLKQAAQLGVQAELDNIAMYQAFLATAIVSRPENADVKALFENLMRASENHLNAFRNQLARFG